MKLALFFTRGVSLQLWYETGLLYREKLSYEQHLIDNNFERVLWLTYGSGDKNLSLKLKKEGLLHSNIEILEMPKLFNIPKIGSYIYSLIIPFIHHKKLSTCKIIKTNQMDGSWSAVISKIICKKKLLLRTGFTISQLEYNKNGNSLKFKYWRLVEKLAYKIADRAQASSKNNIKYILQKIQPNCKFNLVYNFIDTTNFKPKNFKKFKNRIIFVGRLNEEKNLFNLIKAISSTNFILDIYGDGILKKELFKFSQIVKANINFKGTISNEKLADIYNKYPYYIISSFFEGMPKTLLEAMACGCICIGTNVNGINEVIKDQVNGYLCNSTDPDSLVKVINSASKKNNTKIIKNGIDTVQKNFSLKKIVKLEKEIIDSMVHG